MQAAPSGNKFIHFGCWNQFECGDNNNPVSLVTSAVRKRIEEDKTFTDLIVAGDNYYPSKKTSESGEKQKTISTSDLTSGFECLNIEGVTTYMLWGNHDLDNSDNLFVTDPHDDKLLIRASECLTLKTEEANERDGLKFPDKSRIILTKIDGNTAFIMLDTTVYDILGENEPGEEVDSGNTISCYNQYYGVGSLRELKDRQHDAILEFVKGMEMENVTNLILIGHHPLLYVKVKEDKKKGRTIKKVNLHDIYELLLDINRELQGVNYYYLCADYHNYQRGTVTIDGGEMGKMKIAQYIVGTGGTELDPPLGEVDLEKPIAYDGTVNATYAFREDLHQHGFLVGTITPDVPLFEFIAVATPIGGRARKTRRKRTRKTRRKRTRKTRRH